MTDMSTARRSYLTRFLRMFMRELRWLHRRRRGTEAGPRGDRCRSCAFQPGTDSRKGFDSTASGLLRALFEGRPFYCHAGLPKGPGPDGQYLLPADPSKLRWCAGWAAVAEFGPTARRDVEALAIRAAQRAGEMPA
jgi:hypothetical protein